MGKITNRLTHNNVNSNQQPDPKSPEKYQSDSSKIIGTVTNSLIQNNGNIN
jgi:hypothetical protein